MKYKLNITILVAGIVFTASAAQAQSTPLTAKAQLAAKCELSASNIDIGEIIPGQASSSGTSTFSVYCTRATPFRYYIAYRQYGWDCAFLEGINKKDKVLYGIWDMQTNSIAANNILTPLTATGNTQLLAFKAEIQPSWGSPACPTPYRAPYRGFNPYITPDTYSDNVVFGIIY